MDSDLKNINPAGRNTKQKKLQQIQTNKRNIGNNMFAPPSRAKKVLHIGVKH